MRTRCIGRRRLAVVIGRAAPHPCLLRVRDSSGKLVVKADASERIGRAVIIESTEGY